MVWGCGSWRPALVCPLAAVLGLSPASLARAGALYSYPPSSTSLSPKLKGMADQDPIIDEALDNLQEAAQRIRATQNRMRAAGLQEHPNFRELSTRLSVALGVTEAACLEARRRSSSQHNS